MANHRKRQSVSVSKAEAVQLKPVLRMIHLSRVLEDPEPVVHRYRPGEVPLTAFTSLCKGKGKQHVGDIEQHRHVVPGTQISIPAPSSPGLSAASLAKLDSDYNQEKKSLTNRPSTRRSTTANTTGSTSSQRTITVTPNFTSVDSSQSYAAVAARPASPTQNDESVSSSTGVKDASTYCAQPTSASSDSTESIGSLTSSMATLETDNSDPMARSFSSSTSVSSSSSCGTCSDGSSNSSTTPYYILDNGCGHLALVTSALLSFLSDKRVAYVDIVATDLSQRSLLRATRTIETMGNHASAMTLQLDMADLDSFVDSNFTHAFSAFALQSHPDPVFALKQMSRTLKPAGRLGLTLWSKLPWVDICLDALGAIEGLPKLPSDSAGIVAALTKNEVKLHEQNTLKDVLHKTKFTTVIVEEVTVEQSLMVSEFLDMYATTAIEGVLMQLWKSDAANLLKHHAEPISRAIEAHLDAIKTPQNRIELKYEALVVAARKDRNAIPDKM